MTESVSKKPLSDVFVLDLSRVLAGPLATQQLADLGARVVKVEPPGGDGTRSWGPPFWDADRSGYYLSCNRGKESVALDLRTPEARSVLARLVERADVIIENFRPGTLEGWGWSLEEWRSEYPRLVTCSITGFGTGTLREHLGGYDALIQAMSGFMSITGDRDGPPTKVGVAVVDVLTGLHAATGILAALASRTDRERFSTYRHVEIALAEAALAGLVNVAACAVNGLSDPDRWGNEHPTIYPYAPFRCRDRVLFIGVGSDRQWSAMIDALECPDWRRALWSTNAGRVSDRDRLRAVLEADLRERSADDVEAALERAGVPVGPIRDVGEAFADPDVRTREAVIEHDDGTRSVASPVRFGVDAKRCASGLHPPRLGEHTRPVLSELGYSAPEIDKLVAVGGVGVGGVDTPDTST